MSHKLALASATALCIGACSLINAPEDLKPTSDASGATDAGGAGSGGSSNEQGGKSSPSDGGGDSVSMAGTSDAGSGGCGADCAEGGAPPLGRACEVSADDCSGAAPICDDTSGACRACGSDDECSQDLRLGFCLTSGVGKGRCVECQTDDDCSDAKAPVCGTLGVCRGCDKNDECASGVCDPNGACASQDANVYALAETGATGTMCGTLEQPCRFLATAVTQLSSTRHNLVLLKTTKAFNDSVTLPAIKGLRVIGNGVHVGPSGPAGAFLVPAGASVGFEDIVIANGVAANAPGIKCTGGSLGVVRSQLEDNLSGIAASDCDVVVSESLFQGNAPDAANATAAITSSCSSMSCDKTTSFVRNQFVDNGVAVYLSNQAEASIENNLFLRNGYDNYTRVLELRSVHTRVAYNTLVENFNNGIYVGIIACIGACDVVANVTYNNFPGHPEYGDQVIYGGTLTYNLTEVTYPGTTNRSGDPLFVDPDNGDYTPGRGSPAIDHGDPNDFPELDINGKKRTGKPDIGAYESP